MVIKESIHKVLDNLIGKKDDQKTLHIGNDTLRIEKRFRVPINKYYLDMFEHRDKFKYNIIPNYDFYIRFYFPRSKLIKLFDNKANDELHLIVMFNGLDESLEQHYKLYDRLGTSFAFYGVASVLLPTPFHLNRSAIEFKKEPNERTIVKIPSISLLENPWYLPNNFAQTILEFNYFLKLIRCEFKDIRNDPEFKGVEIQALSQDDINFYKLFFEDKKLDVSLLGYSLGGLKALACFKQKPEAIKTCILLNSGGTLRNLKLGPPLMENDIWQNRVVEPLLKRYPTENKYEREFEAFGRCKNKEIISSIIYDEDKIFDGAKFDKHVCKIIIVAGGKDRLVEPESIKRLETQAHGLNIFQIADLSHFIGDDPQFNRWYSRIINLLINFFEDIEGESISRTANIVLFSIFDYCCDNELIKGLSNFQKVNQLAEIVKEHMNENQKNEFYLLIRSLFAYYNNIKEFIKQLEKYKKKNNLFFGQIATEFAKSNHKKLEEIILKNNTTLRSGEKLSISNELLEHQIDRILVEQAKQYINKFEKDDAIGEYWKQILAPFLEKKKNNLETKNKGSNL